MSTPSTTPSFLFTSSPNPALPSTSADHEDLESVHLIAPSENGPHFTDQELALNSSIRPRSRATTPQISDVGPSSFGVGTYGKEVSQFLGNASFEGGPHTTKIRRKYHRDESSPLPYPPSEGLSSRSDSGSEKEGLPRISPHSNPPSKMRLHLSRHAFTIHQVARAFPFSLSRLRAIPDSPLLWLLLYFTLNLSLTLYNKTVLIHFPFPYTLTALHAFCGTIGTHILLRINPAPGGSQSTGARMTVPPPPQAQHPTVPNLNGKELIVLLLFSVLYTVNIVVSNASLRLVTVPFHQVVRASTPFFTIMFAAAILGKRCSKQKLLSLVPVVIGVGFATYGDYYFTAFGFFLTLLGTVLASLKTILTNVILAKPTATGLPISSENNHAILHEKRSQSPFPPSFISSVSSLLVKRVLPPTPSSSPAYPIKSHSSPSTSNFAFSLPKLSLSPIHLLYLLSPLAFIQTTLLAHFTGELDRVRWHLFDPATATTKYGSTAVNGRMWLILNGILAFMLNVVSFNANRRVGPLGMSVAANVKQVLTVLSAVILFDLTITPANGLGILLTLVGGALYAAVELREKKEIKSRIG